MIEDVLGSVCVAQLMNVNVPLVPPNIPVSTLVYDYIIQTDEHAFPVIDNGRLVGLVSIRDIRKVPRPGWEQTEVGEIMTAAAQLTTARPGERASQALCDMVRHDMNQIPVLQDGRLVGMLQCKNILRWLQLQCELEGGDKT